MSDPSTLSEWVAHCRTQADGWWQHAATSAGLTEATNPAMRHGADWQALRDLLAAVDTLIQTGGWPPGHHVAAAARLADHLPTAPTTEGTDR